MLKEGLEDVVELPGIYPTGLKPTPEIMQRLYEIDHPTEKAKKTFTLSDKEYENAMEFAKGHEKCRTGTATGEKLQYIFIPGGIGTYTFIECLICKDKKNITDFDCW